MTETFTYKNAIYTAAGLNAWKVLSCLYDNMVTYGAEARFVEGVKELISDGLVKGPLAVLS